MRETMSHVGLSILGDCVIEVGGSQVTPAAPHLFALLLVFALERQRRISRAELQELLFEQDLDSRLGSHSLRQLLYRLRRMGLCFDERSSGITLADVAVSGPLH